MCRFATEQVCQMERCYSDCLCRISTTNNKPKNPQFCRPLVKGGGFRKKTGGIGLGTIKWFASELIAKYRIQTKYFQSLSQLCWQLSLSKRALLFVRFKMLICNRISHINKMFYNLSVSYADSSLYQRELILQYSVLRFKCYNFVTFIYFCKIICILI